MGALALPCDGCNDVCGRLRRPHRPRETSRLDHPQRYHDQFLPTQLAESLMTLPWPKQSAFRSWLTGADTLRRRPSHELPFSVVNNDGPIECTVVATSDTIDPDENASAAPTIGRPIDNATAYIVDDPLRRVPDGTPGELLIGGQCVAEEDPKARDRRVEGSWPTLSVKRRVLACTEPATVADSCRWSNRVYGPYRRPDQSDGVSD